MDATEQVRRFEEFFSRAYKGKVLEAIGKGKSFVVVDFKELLGFDSMLAEDVLDSPDDGVKAAEVSISSLDFPSDVKNFRVRFKNLPSTNKITISELRSAHLGKFLTVTGIVRQKSDVRPQVTTSKFECPNCGNVISVLQLESSFREPERCGCGRRGKFRLLVKELVDAQGMVLEESPDELGGGEQPRRVNIFLKEDLVSPIADRRTNPGSRVVVVGVLKEVPVFIKGTKSTRFDLLFEANYIEAVEEDFYQIEVSKDEERAILELSQDPRVYERLVASLLPTIHGYERIKEALLLQLLGGVHKKRKDGGTSRGDCHILLVGDPGAGKSAILKRISSIAPKGRYVAGKGSSGAGLTAAVVKDEFLGGWSLEAGALVLSNNGLVAIDEMDKMTDEDRAAMHEALEQQCYHYETELMFADGKTEKIGVFVDGLFAKHSDKVVIGSGCELLSIPSLPEVLTTDFSGIYPVQITRVNRIKAPEFFYRLTYRNGRSIMVTPEHPVYVEKNGEITTCRAEEVKVGMLAPSPRRLPVKAEFDVGENEKLRKYGLFLGLQCSEGYSYKSIKHRYSEFGISNTNPEISRLAEQVMAEVFEKQPFMHIRAATAQKATMALLTVRMSSKSSYQKLEQEVPEILKKAREKRVPQLVKSGADSLKCAFLQGFFLGDGYVDGERTGFTTSSRFLAEDLQQLLLQQEIYSYVETDNSRTAKYYKVVVSGLQSYRNFYDLIPDMDLRKGKIWKLLLRSSNKNNDRDVLPHSYLADIRCAYSDMLASS
ncbi:hypothetical protein HYU12_05115 [Candidatus Woesearchaeota archaeon]|nr:hypothetical protein [Candidatus Woesearchaeota archaeon]